MGYDTVNLAEIGGHASMKKHSVDFNRGIEEGGRVSISPIEEKKLEFSF